MQEGHNEKPQIQLAPAPFLGKGANNGILPEHILHAHVFKFLPPNMLLKLTKVSRVVRHYANLPFVWMHSIRQVTQFVPIPNELPNEGCGSTSSNKSRETYLNKLRINNPSKWVYAIIHILKRRQTQRRSAFHSKFINHHATYFEILALTPSLYETEVLNYNGDTLRAKFYSDPELAIERLQDSHFAPLYMSKEESILTLQAICTRSPNEANTLFEKKPEYRGLLEAVKDHRHKEGHLYAFLRDNFLQTANSKNLTITV